jgi:hypothetical protein
MLRIDAYFGSELRYCAVSRIYVATYGTYYAFGVCPLRAAAHVLRLAAGMEDRR